MLVLSRRVGQEVLVDGGIRIKVTHAANGRVKFGIEAPRSIGIVRPEAKRQQPQSVKGANRNGG